MEIEYEPRFLDEAVLRALGTRPEARRFHRERGHVYRIADAEQRANAFDALNAAWYERLGLAQPLADALAEQPLVLVGVARCAVGRPPHRREAGAELLVRRPASGEPTAIDRLLRVLFAPEALFEPARLAPFLRRELQHVADMLDPRFGYRPELPPVAGGPTYERLLRERYRVAWDVTVDGRLLRAGRLPPTVRAERQEEFAHAFPALGAAAAADAFARFFDDPESTHAAIADFVTATAAGGRAGPGACTLCGFPGSDLEPDLAGLPPAVVAEIGRDFPDWTPADGCCRQCADLYRAHQLSAASLAALPGIR